MRKAFALLTAGTALLVTPAFAQANLGAAVDTTVGANSGVVGDTVGSVTGPVGDTVDKVDGAANKTLDATKLKLATSEQVRAGVNITDSAGNSVGTVQSVDGDNAVVVDGGKLYNVPLSSLYARAEGSTNALVTKLPKAEIAARVQGGAETR